MAYLIDTNLLVYPFDARDPAKQARARQALSVLSTHGTGRLSSQALSEFSNVMLRKLGTSAEKVYGLVDTYEQLFPVYPLTPAVVLEAVRGVRDYALAYYDAQVWASAKLNQIPTILE